MIDTEYAEFGPWIIEFYDKNRLPKRFVSHVDMEKNYELLIKIPKEIERRLVRQGMDLYAAVLGIYKEKMYFYENTETEVTETIIDLKDIHSIKMEIDLLLGHLFLQLSDRVFTFIFNTSSRKIVEKIISIIRGHYILEYKSTSFEFLEENILDDWEHYYKTAMSKINMEEDNIRIIGLQPIHKLKYQELSLFKRMWYLLTKSTLLSCIYLTNGQELIIVKNRRDYLEKVDHSHSITYIPFFKISEVNIIDSEYTTEVKKIAITNGNTSLDLLFAEENKYLYKLYRELTSLA